MYFFFSECFTTYPHTLINTMHNFGIDVSDPIPRPESSIFPSIFYIVRARLLYNVYGVQPNTIKVSIIISISGPVHHKDRPISILGIVPFG